MKVPLEIYKIKYKEVKELENVQAAQSWREHFKMSVVSDLGLHCVLIRV